MPNTLAHLGVQGIITRSLLKDVDYKWVYLGCIIPDLPWILQRIVRSVYPDIDPYDLRLFVIIQSTLCFCLILSAAIATLSVNFWRVFAILGLNSFLHLFIDACQTKWANGVHFLAPFNWHLINFGLFWPESLPTYILTIFGIGYLLWNWRPAVVIPIHITWRPAIRLFALIAVVAVYFSLPLLLLDGPEGADNHFVKTLRTLHDRPGRHIELDRNSYISHPSGGAIRTFTGEELNVDDMRLDYSAPVSVKGSFVTEDKIQVSQYHVHSKWIRDGSSYLGLLLTFALFIHALVIQKFIKGEVPQISV
jgi:hypothetical protein